MIEKFVILVLAVGLMLMSVLAKAGDLNFNFGANANFSQRNVDMILSVDYVGQVPLLKGFFWKLEAGGLGSNPGPKCWLAGGGLGTVVKNGHFGISLFTDVIYLSHDMPLVSGPVAFHEEAKIFYDDILGSTISLNMGHISNAGLGPVNHGYDFLLGLSYGWQF